MLNFALNLEYLEAEYYCYAYYGKSIEDQFGVGTEGVGGSAGTLTVKPNFAARCPSRTRSWPPPTPRRSPTTRSTTSRSCARALGSAAVARPDIDLLNSFNTLADAAAGIPGCHVRPVCE